MSTVQTIAAPKITVNVLPDGSREISATITIPADPAITNCRHFEQGMQKALNCIGQAGMALGLAAFDTQGEPIVVGRESMTSKGRFPTVLRTLFGEVRLDRHVYQTSCGGKTFVPMEANARILRNCTPQLASCVAGRYAEVCARKVESGFRESNQLHIDTNLVQEVSRDLGKVAIAKEDYWSYCPAVKEEDVATIGLGVDGALVPILHESEWRQSMVGTLTLYDKEGNPLHTAYFAKAPQAGKQRFEEQLKREVAAYKKFYPNARWIGISDGAEDLRRLLSPHCSQLVLDFYHVAEYLAAAAGSMQEVDTQKARETWLEHTLHDLKHKKGAAARILNELEQRLAQFSKRNRQVRELEAAVSYLRNNQDRMDYAACVKEKLPIGSGITEAACKTLVKMRFCGAGMSWHGDSMEQLLAVKALRESTGRWEEFWTRIDNRGY